MNAPACVVAHTAAASALCRINFYRLCSISPFSAAQTADQISLHKTEASIPLTFPSHRGGGGCLPVYLTERRSPQASACHRGCRGKLFVNIQFSMSSHLVDLSAADRPSTRPSLWISSFPRSHRGFVLFPGAN